MRTAISYFLFFFVLLLFAAVNLFIAIALVSILIVPLTWLYAKLSGQSYNFTIDQSNILYKLNNFGQWSLLIGGSLLLLYFIIYIL
jgi:hypothetical protein